MNQDKELVEVCLLSEDDKHYNQVVKELSDSEKEVEKNYFQMGNINVYYLPEYKQMWDVYNKCYNYEHFILRLSNLSFTKKDSEDMKVGNNYFYIQMVQRLQAKQVYVMLQGEEFDYKQPADLDKLSKWVEESIKEIWLGKNQNLKENEENPLDLPLPQLVVGWSLHKQKMIEFFKPNLAHLKKETVVQIIHPNKKQSYDIYILSGIIYQDMTLYAQDGKFTIQSISLHNKDVKYSLAGQFVNIRLKADVPKLQGIAYTHYAERTIVKQFQLDVVFQEIDQTPIKKKIDKLKTLKLLYLGQEYDILKIVSQGKIEKGEVKEISNQLQEFIAYRIQITLAKPIYYYENLDKYVFIYKKDQKSLTFYGKIVNATIESVTKYPQNPARFVLLPKYKSNPSQLMLYNNKDGRYLCRICKEANAYQILLECGHMRYCDDCCQLCVENKVCYYCDKEVKRMKRLNLEYMEEDEYKTYQQMNQEQIIEYFRSSEKKEQPSVLKLLNKCIEQNANFHSFLCQHCDKNLILRYQYCENQDFHFYLVCEKCSYPQCPDCNKPISVAMNIQYRFPDDPQIEERQEKKEKKEKKEQQIKNNK